MRRESLAIFHAAIIAAFLEGSEPSSSAENPPDPPDEERDAYRTVVASPSEDPLEVQRELDARTPGFSTAVDLEHQPGTRPSDAMGEVIARTPGATVRSIGGLGQFSAVSIRGSAPQQVAVFLDGVPLGGSMAGLVDIGDLSMDGLDRIEIYRGHVPVAFGAATIGGAINLVNRVEHTAARARVWGGYGSQGAREARLELTGAVAPGLQLSGRFGYAGAEGNFAHFDHGGTPTFTGDDRIVRRTNNHYDRVLGQLRLDGRRGAWRYGLAEIVGFKAQGIAGAIGAPARAAALSTFAARTLAHVERHQFGGPGGRVGWVTGVGAQYRVYTDPLGEVGIDIDDQRTRVVDVYTSPRMRLPLWRGAFLGLVADGRYEWIELDERAPVNGPSQDAVRRRWTSGLGLELEQFLFERRLLVVPAMRIEALYSQFAVAPGQGEQDDEGRDDVTVGYAPRLGTRLRLWPGFELRASGGRYYRPPTLVELFGDRGYFTGNEGLRSERGTAVDGGLVVDLEQPRVHVYGQLAGFGTWSEDLIQWIAAGPVARPENVPGARVRGLEIAFMLAARDRPMTLAANYTLVDSEDRSNDPTRRGRPLPGRPRHEAFVRPTVGHVFEVRSTEVEPRLVYTVEFVAGTFLDPSGRFELPPRALQGLGAELHLARRVHFAIEVRNLLDVRTGTVTFPVGRRPRVPVALSDFIGFPLPGRSVWASLRIDMHLQRRAPSNSRPNHPARRQR